MPPPQSMEYAVCDSASLIFVYFVPVCTMYEVWPAPTAATKGLFFFSDFYLFVYLFSYLTASG